jgi:hypothetical protein
MSQDDNSSSSRISHHPHHRSVSPSVISHQGSSIGTPGTGKTLHSTILALNSEETETPFQHLNVGDIVKQHGFHEGWDEEWQTYTIDEDRLLDYMEEIVNPKDGAAKTGV